MSATPAARTCCADLAQLVFSGRIGSYCNLLWALSLSDIGAS